MESSIEQEGVLIAIGGAEDRGEEEYPKLPFEEKGILKHVLSQANGVDSKVFILTTASKIPNEVAAAYFGGFDRLGCKAVVHHHIVTKDEANRADVMADLESADVVFWSGGNQSRIPRAFRKTAFLKRIKERFQTERLVIAGTSAGAMCMSKYMIAGGSASEAFAKGNTKMRKGLSFAPELIIDTHFVRRGRFGRLAEAVARFPECVGIGLAEDTGVVIRRGREFRVIGSGMVIVMDAQSLQHNNYELLHEGTLMSLAGLTTHFLANGDRFELQEHAIEVLPLGEAYI